MKIEIASEQVDARSIEGKRGQFTLYEQEAYAHLPGRRYPERFVITLPKERNGKPYAVGQYTLASESFYVGRFNQLECRPVLAPLQAATKAA